MDSFGRLVLAVLVAVVSTVVAQPIVPQRAEAQAGEVYLPPGYAQPPAQPGSAQPPAAYGPPTQTVVVLPYAPATQLSPTSPQMHPVQVERSESIRALWLPGVIALPIAWLSTWTAASTYFEGDALAYSWIPVIGPWLMLTQDLNGLEAAVIISGVVQGAATLMIVLGLALRRTWIATEYVVEPIPGQQAHVSFDAIGLPGGGMLGARVRM